MEDDYVVWEGMSRVLGGLKEMLDFTDLCDKFFLWALRILRSQKERLGWDPIPEEGTHSSLSSCFLVLCFCRAALTNLVSFI